MKTIPTLTIMLADDHAVVREGIRAVIAQQSDLSIVAEVADGWAAISAAKQYKPDVILMDMKMPGPGPVQTILSCIEASTQTHILVFTSYAEESQVRDVLNAGALGYLLKDAVSTELLRALRTVGSGQVSLDPSAQKQMLSWLRKPQSPIEQLTTREKSVLALIAKGCNNKTIADKLNLTEGTVKGYVSQILEKLDVDDRTQAALLANQHGVF